MNLIELLRIVDRHRVPLFTSVLQTTQHPDHFRDQTVYTVELRINTQVAVKALLEIDGSIDTERVVMEEALQNIQRQLYSDFLLPLNQLHYAIQRHEMGEAQDQLDILLALVKQ